MRTLAQQMFDFTALGIDTKKKKYGECVDELIDRYKELLEDREISDFNFMGREFRNIKTVIRKN